MKLIFRRLSSTWLIIAILYGGGCSFHSTQYEFVKSLVSKKDESGPKKNWIIEWNGLRTPVYAINGQGYVLFADEFGAQLLYQGAQVTYIKGLLAKAQGEEITVAVTLLKDGVKLSYETRGESIKEAHSCSLWQPSAVEVSEVQDAAVWVQNCTYANGAYENRKWLNEFGQLFRLEFLLKPGYPPANVFIL